MNHDCTPSPTVYIGKVPVGDNYPTVFMAEVGTFFNQDIELAKEFLHAAVEAGVQVFKTEILHNADVCLKGTGLSHEYNHAGGKHVEDYRALVERKVVPLKDYRKIFQLCHDLDIPVVASVYDLEGIDFLKAEKGSAIKIARDNINNVPLIRYAAKSGLPIILDAGGTYLDEVAFAVRLIRNAGGNDIIVNLHPAANPAPAQAHNLRVISLYKQAFDIPVGLSCHYRGDEILYVAVGQGLNLIEKGIFDDPDKIEQDIVSALDVRDLKSVVQKVRNCWMALGKGQPQVKEPRDLSTRKGLVALADIAQGETLNHANVGYAWPPLGISVEYWDTVMNKTAQKAIPKNQIISWADIKF